MDNHEVTQPQIVAYKYSRRHTLNVADIVYVEAVDKYAVIHCNNDVYLLDDSLKMLADTYPELLIRIHRKFLVSKSRIERFKRHWFPKDFELTLKDHKQTFPVSRRCAPVVSAYMESFKGTRKNKE